MLKRCNGLNSKCFLLTYLLIVSFLLILWANHVSFEQQDERVIPQRLQSYLLSPPQHIEDITVNFDIKQVLTSEIYQEKWSFAYFSHWQCLPDCDHALQTLSQLEQALQAADIQFVLLNLDVAGNELSADRLAALAKQYSADFPVLDFSNEVDLQTVADQFKALFLKTPYADGSYLIEQQHSLFLVDPKGRVYARFVPPYSFESIRQAFIDIRLFYAQSE